MSARLDPELSARRAKRIAELREEGMRMAEICAALGITMRQAVYAENYEFERARVAARRLQKTNTQEQRT